MNQSMEPGGAGTDVDPLVNRHPPIWQELVIRLYFQPRQFFSELSLLLLTKYIVAVCLVSGMAQAIDKVDQEMLKASLGQSSNRTQFIALFTDSWLNMFAASQAG